MRCAGASSAGGWTAGFTAAAACLDRRKAHHELAAEAQPIAVRGDRAAVHFDDALDERQPDAEAAARSAAGAIGLAEHVEHARQHLRMNADAGVADAHDGVAALAGRT